jgi:hypothetical protein
MRLGSSSLTSESSRTKIVDNDSSSDDEKRRDLSPRRKVTVDSSMISNLLNFSDTEDDEMSGDELGFDRRRISVATLLSRQTSVESTATLDDDFVCYVRKKEQIEDRGRKASVGDKSKIKERAWKKKCKSDYLTKIFLINRSFDDKNGLSNRHTSKNLLSSIFTHLTDIAMIPP